MRGVGAQYVSGFTLIELLVVIAIIGVLASIVLASLNSARGKARDSRRMADLKQLQTALEFYYDDNNSYPSTGGVWHGNCSSYGSYGTTGSSGWIPNLAPSYISVLPVDPRPVGTNGCYLYRSDGTNYKILAYLTTESVCPVPSTNSFYDPVRSTQCTFQVSTSGARSTY